MNKILFLAANPLSPNSTVRLALDHEARDIEQRLHTARHRDFFEIKTKWALRPVDLHDALLREEPTIVHFSGHGTGVAGIVLQGYAEDESRLISTDALKHLFSTLKGNIRIIVLNACYSEEQARALVEKIDFVVGMKDSIGDQAARNFAAAFYTGLGFGRSIQTAFDLGINAIKLEGLVHDEDIPVLLVRDGVDANHVVLVGAKPPEPIQVATSWGAAGPSTSSNETAFNFTPPVIGSNAPLHPQPSKNESTNSSVSEKAIRGIFRKELENKDVEPSAIHSATQGLFSRIAPTAAVSADCILLLRTMRCIASLQRIIYPSARDVDWVYTDRLLEATEGVLVEQGHDIESLNQIAIEALKLARSKRFLIFKDEDEWRPGMASGSGWVEYACLSNIGDKLLDRTDR